MADNIVDIPLACPIRFFPQEDPEYPSFDNAPAIDIVPPQKRPVSYNDGRQVYTQKWFNDGITNDIIALQISSTFSPVALDLLDCNGDVVNSYIPSSPSNPAILLGWALYEWQLNPPLMERYYWKLRVGVEDTLEVFISEPQETIKDKNKTLFFKYKNSFNYFDIVFGTGIEFQFRCEGRVGRIQPKMKGADWEDQPLNLETIKAKPFRMFPLIIGEDAGVADWVADKVNCILAMDTDFINGIQYTKPVEEELQPQEIGVWPWTSWTVNIRQTKNRRSLRRQNGNSPAEFFLVTYNIDTRLFGTMNAPPSTNPITIVSVE